MKKIILFGAGAIGLEAMKYYGKENIIFWVDNDYKKVGTEIEGIPVIGVEELKKIYYSYTLVLAMNGIDGYYVGKQLSGLGIPYEVYWGNLAKCDNLILNNYLDKDNTNEDEWIENSRKNPNIQKINRYVSDAIQNVPLFCEIEIETVNRCNGVCSFCPVNCKIDPRKKMFMDDSIFYKIIDELAVMDYNGRVALFSNNEPFLDKRIIKFSEYTRYKLRNAKIHLSTNGTLLTLEKFKKIITLVDELIIDNYNQELMLNSGIEMISEYIKHNRELEKKVTIVLRKVDEVLTTRGGDSPNRTRLLKLDDVSCALPFQQMIIRPDGKVSLCCNDPLGKDTLGDVRTQSLKDIWYSEQYQTFRNCIIKGRDNWHHCEYCDTILFF